MTGETQAIKAILMNDEASTDAELIAHFQAEFGMDEWEAREWVKRRDEFLNGSED